MARYLVGRGTLLNTATVAVGALIGLAAGRLIPESYGETARDVLGLATIGIGVKMFLQSKSVLIVAVALVFGAVTGKLIGVQAGLESFAEWAKVAFGAEGSATFTEAVVSTTILFCVGPMTLLGCVRDALEDDIELLAIKSTLDGLGAVFFAAALGPGVLVTAGLVFVIQGTLAALATPLKPITARESILAEVTACGGAMMMAIGFGLLEITRLPVADYLPALVIAPVAVAGWERWRKEPKGEPTKS